jgi:predicted CxxxxCH...CXXCH cytochrome family protein
VWTGGASQAACGTCHGTPPGGSHPIVTGGLPACNTCHSQTVDANGNIIPPASGGKHLDGIVEASGHSADWMNQSSTGFHAYSANQGLASCQGCHGVDLEGGSVGVACASCHGSGWKTNCVMCHGGVDNSTGAPPSPTWGHGDPSRGGGTPDPVRVGAHTIHLTGGPMAGAFECAVCHTVPTDALSQEHIDQPTATLTFSGRATVGTTVTPSWTRSNATCSGVYCHGATIRQQELTQVGSIPRGTNVTPNWTAGSSQAACGTCHGLPPDTGMHFYHVVTGQIGSYLACSDCHYGYQGFPSPSDTGVPTPSLHVNGIKDVIISPDAADTPADAGTRINGWNATGCHAVVACHGML